VNRRIAATESAEGAEFDSASVEALESRGRRME
jgi:hypothetical protein